MNHLLPLQNDFDKEPDSTQNDFVRDMYRFSKYRRLDRRCCRCCRLKENMTRQSDFSIRDFPFVYQKIMSMELTQGQKMTILMRYTNIMDKIKTKYRFFFLAHTCTKSCLIVGNILVPSILSIEAMFYENKDVRMVVFWGVWALSLVIALISSFVTFFNTQRKYNLYNQFNTLIQREIFAYIQLTGAYRILSEHLDFLRPKETTLSCLPGNATDDPANFELDTGKRFDLSESETEELESEEDNPVMSKTEKLQKESGEEKIILHDLPNSDIETEPPRPTDASTLPFSTVDLPSRSSSPTTVPSFNKQSFPGVGPCVETKAIESKHSGPIQDPVPPPEDLFVDNDVTKYSVEDVPFINQKGHMFHYSLFLENLEKLYRRLTNSNIDINHDDVSSKPSKNALANQKK